MTITGGTVTAVTSSTGTAIGGGIGWSNAGGEGNVEITGGEVYAYNHGYYGSGYYVPATAIGGASSHTDSGTLGTVKISGGTVYAQCTGGTAIGGGGSTNSSGGAANVTISDLADVTAKSVSGTVNGYSVDAGTSIGGGTGKTAGGNVTFKMTGGILKTGSVGGGKKTSASNAYGSGSVTIEGGTINGQFVLSPPASGHSSFTMKGGTINGKLDGFTYMQPDGYAVWMNDGGGTVTINQSVGTSKITGCTGAGNGGAIYMLSGTFTLTAGTIEKCSATNGGAVYMGGGTFNMNGGTIGGSSDAYANSASAQGGGIYMGGGAFTMKGGTISYNKTQKTVSDSHGGGIYIGSGGTVTINGGTISNNTANYGGGFYVNPGANQTTTINNTNANTTISGNKARYGAGAFIESGTISVSSTNSRTTTVSNNIADYSGGGFYVKGTANLSGVLLNGNQANGTDADNRGGGGMFVTGNYNNSISGGTVNNNTAKNKGGGVYINAGANYTLTISGAAQMNNNSAKYGAGAYIAAGKLSVTGASASSLAQIQSNTAKEDGGGVYAAAGSVTASNASINSNTARRGNGGGIYAIGAVTITGGTVSSNHADTIADNCGLGGGIYAEAGSNNILVQTSAILGSNSAKMGAGIYAKTGNVQVTSSQLNSNAASADGGGVYAEGGSVTLTTATLSSNSATSGNGGGIYGGGGNITVNAGSIATNTAANGNGGGVYATGGTITFGPSGSTDPTFTGNSAINGGVLYMEGGTCNINAGTLGGSHANRNKATTSGGAIYVDGGTVNFATGTISYNTAGTSGGGLFVASNGTLKMTGDVTLNYNHVPANKHGGGVYLAGVLEIGASTARTVIAQYNYADGTETTDLAASSINSTNRNNVYLPEPVASSSAPHKDVITVVKNGLTTSTRVGFSVPHNFVPVIYCNEEDPYTYLRSFLQNPDSKAGGMWGTVFDDAEKYTTVHYPNNSFYDPQHIYLSGGTWVDHVSSYTIANPPEGFSVSGTNVTISSNEALAWLIKYINGISPYTSANAGVNVTLAANVDMGDYAWVPIGSTGASQYSNDVVFTGTFNGNGYTISNINCQYLGTQTGNNLGLFGQVGSNATVENVQLKDALVNTADMTSGTAYLGCIAGTTTGGTIQYCSVSGSMETLNPDAVMGGLVGLKSGGEIHSSLATPEMQGYTMGGLVGQHTGGNLYNSFANPKFTYSGPSGSTNYYVGGLVAENSGTVENCYVRLERAQSLGSALFGMLAGTNTLTIGGTTYNGTISHSFAPDGASAQFNHSYDYLYGGATTGLSQQDLYKKVDAPYLYNRPNDNLVGSTGKTLTEKLNEWVSGKGTNSAYSFWKRTTAGGYATSSHAGNINDDYPIHKMKGFTCAASPDGVFIHYKASLNRMLSDYNDEENGGTVWLYASPKDASNADENVYVDNGDNVRLYIDEDATLLQSDGNVLKAFTSQTLGDYTTRGERWHYASSSLKQSDIGFSYASDNEPFSWAPNPCGVSFSTTNDNALFPGDMTSSDITKIDLYAFYEPEYHWVNLKRNTNSHWHMNAHEIPIYYNGNGTGGNGNETYLVPGKGYLMSIDKEQLLQNWGELNNDNVTLQDVTYTEYNAWAGLLGYNVLGNPYQSYLDFSLFINDSGNASLSASKAAKEVTYATYDPRYDAYVQYKAGSSKGSRSADGYIHPHQGFLIRRSGGAASTTATFTNDMRSNDGTSQFRQSEQPAFPLINLMLTDGSGNSDLAVLELGREHNEGVDKLRVGDCGARISLALGQDEYAILFRDEVEDYQSLHLAVETAGTYTLYWETANGEFEALTLVDNITGTRTDMLARDSYMFEATPEQYASRFKIVIGDYKDIEEHEASEPAEGSSPFAFINNGNLIVNGEGSLEMIDVLGRTVKTDELHGSQSTVSMPQGAAGVYVLRLTLDGVTKVQKIVIK